jgi:hypothetical protein
MPVIVQTFVATPTSQQATTTVERATGFVDPEFEVSKKYPTVGYITGRANLTIRVIPPLTFNEEFRSFLGRIWRRNRINHRRVGGIACDTFY